MKQLFILKERNGSKHKKNLEEISNELETNYTFSFIYSACNFCCSELRGSVNTVSFLVLSDQQGYHTDWDFHYRRSRWPNNFLFEREAIT